MQTLLLCAVFALVQAEKPKPAPTVDQTLATALKSHPDIKVAEAKLRLVQVELDQAKVQTVQEVTAAELKVQAAEQAVRVVEETLLMHSKLRDKGTISNEQARASEAAVVQARGGVLAAKQQLDAAKAQPGLKVIEARLQLAAAELEQTRLKVTKGVTVSYAIVQNHREAVQELNQTLILVKKAGAHPLEATKYTIEYLQMKGALATAEAELAAAIGSVVKAEPSDATADLAIVNRLRYARLNAVKELTLAGTAADKLRALLDKSIKLDIKATAFSDLMPEFIKQAGLDGITVRFPTWATGKMLRNPPLIALSGEKTLTAWLELVLDEFNAATDVPPTLGFAPPYIVVVREYGLLIVPKGTAPPDAITLTEFARSVKAEKQAAEQATEEKKKAGEKK